MAAVGPLHREVMGPEDGPPMVFVHPNPMDCTSWMFQLAHFSTWYRCIAIDLPGYGRSPSAGPASPSGQDFTMEDVAEACWEAVDRSTSRRGAVLVGCSIGSNLAQRMYHLRPESTDALVLVGAGWRPVKDFVPRRIADYREHGLGFRYEHTLHGMSEQFAGTALGAWFARMFTERNATADLDTVLALFEALGRPDPENLQSDLRAPVLIVTGSLDRGHAAAHALQARLPEAELVTIEGAGHACHMERPWQVDREMIAFLRARGHTQLPAQLPEP